MRVARVEMRDFRNYERAAVDLPDGLTVICGPNGAGKTNLLEAVYFGCTGPLAAHRERARGGAARRRRRAGGARSGGRRRRGTGSRSGFEPGEPKRMRLDGSRAGAARPASMRGRR